MIVHVPASKSITIRALFMAALAQGDSELRNILISEDTQVCISALKALGVNITIDEKNRIARVQGVAGRFPVDKAAINCSNSGLTARLLLAICSTQPGVYQIDGIKRLRERPMNGLIDVLRGKGIQFDPNDANKLPLTMLVDKSFQGGEILVDAEQSSQFVSALMMAAPLAANPVTIQIKNLVSRPYLDMTINMIQQFGIVVDRPSIDVIHIQNKQSYRARDYLIEPDCSTASYFFALAALLKKEIIVADIHRDNCLQGDIDFLSVLEQMNCQVKQTSQGVKLACVRPLQGVDVDMNHISDTFMTLAAIAPFAETPTTISNIGHVRLKESDRIAAMASELNKLSVSVEVGDDWMRIMPSKPKAAKVDSHNDHRIAMSLAVLASRVSGVVIKNKESVNKTCPEFFALLEGVVL